MAGGQADFFAQPVAPAEKLLPFQRQFVAGALHPDVDTAALSLPRGNGKSWLAAHLVRRVLTPGDDLFRAGTEPALVAGSLEQARIVFRFVRAALEPAGGYRFLDSMSRIGITHVATRTSLRVLASKATTAMGLVDCPLLVADEPGAWEVRGGQLMADAILTALGKPESPMKAVFIGTLAPATSGWWHDLVNGGSKGSTFVMLRQGDRKRWDRWPVIQQANPLTRISPEFRRRLLAERDAAREDTRLKAQFLSYRLNLPTADESEVLLTVEDFDRTCARAVPAREGLPVWGFDLGGGRAWSAAVSIWPAGRCEALAVAPGIPSIDDQERRDRVPRGTYRDLVDAGTLRVAEGLRVPRPEDLVDAALNAWGEPAAAICDRFRAGDMADAAGGRFPVYPRVSRWSEAAADVRALRKIAADGPLAIADGSRGLIQASLAAARVKNDDQGSCRIAKAVHHARSRDDVAAALVLAAGVHVRSAAIPEPARPIHIPLD